MYTEKGKHFVLSVYLCQGKVAPSLFLFLLSILFVLQRTFIVMSHPSWLAVKGEEHWIQKTQTYTTYFFA